MNYSKWNTNKYFHCDPYLYGSSSFMTWSNTTSKMPPPGPNRSTLGTKPLYNAPTLQEFWVREKQSRQGVTLLLEQWAPLKECTNCICEARLKPKMSDTFDCLIGKRSPLASTASWFWIRDLTTSGGVLSIVPNVPASAPMRKLRTFSSWGV